ncbi:HPP family protein [Roseovarius sp. PS-C2]|nr:HPP family protein [Roseovarius sp. PS-C2]
MLHRHLHLSGFLPVLPRPVGREVWRASAGAAVGIGLCAAVAMAVLDAGTFHLSLVAPLGASAVLAFAVPNAPLAQPWSAVAGNTLSALIAVIVLSLYSGPWAPAIAVSLAIAAMMLARALHPPGGAVALLAALDPDPVIEAGFVYALAPVGLMTVLLIGSAILFNRMTGRVYPFRHTGDDEEQIEDVRLGLSEEELATLLQTYRQSSNIGVADLGRLLAAAEREAANHRFDNVTCADIMTADLITVTPDTDIRQAAKLFRQHRIKSLPVVGTDGRFGGLILQADIIDALVTSKLDLRIVGRAPKVTAQKIARPADRSTTTDTPVGQILNRLAIQGTETVPVMAGERLAGIITRSDVMRLLLTGAHERQTV